jgi:hypothetical protein
MFLLELFANLLRTPSLARCTHRRANVWDRFDFLMFAVSHGDIQFLSWNACTWHDEICFANYLIRITVILVCERRGIYLHENWSTLGVVRKIAAIATIVAAAPLVTARQKCFNQLLIKQFPLHVCF